MAQEDKELITEKELYTSIVDSACEEFDSISEEVEDVKANFNDRLNAYRNELKNWLKERE